MRTRGGKITANQPGTCQGGREGADLESTLSVEEAWLKNAITVPVFSAHTVRALSSAHNLDHAKVSLGNSRIRVMSFAFHIVVRPVWTTTSRMLAASYHSRGKAKYVSLLPSFPGAARLQLCSF